MKPRKLVWLTALGLITALALPLGVAAQDNATQNHKGQHHHYKVIDMGTAGGPNSFPSNPSARDINSRGLAIAEAETSIPDPYAPNCLQPPDCLVNHVIAWQNGVQTDLGALPGGNNSSIASWVNDQGIVVGVSNNNLIDPLTGFPEFSGVLWKGGKIHELASLGGNGSFAYAINDRGQVVGFALNTIPDSDVNGLTVANFPLAPFPVATQFRAVLWQGGVIHDLGTLGRGNDAAAFLLNDRGQVAGVSFTDTILNASGVPTEDPFFWEDGKMVDIGSFGGTHGEPSWMNSRGQVVGFSNVAGDQDSHAFVWDKKQGLKDLGTLPGDSSSGANWINDAGEIVGGSCGANSCPAVLWKNGAMIDLGVLVANSCSWASSINSQGQIVGTSSSDCNLVETAVLFQPGGSPIDLNSLIPPGSGFSVAHAVDINDRGEIVAFGHLPNGDFHSVVLIPCDENHAGVEDCDYDAVDAATAAQAHPAPLAPSSAAASFARLSPAEQKARIRSFMAQHQRRFGARSHE